MVFNDRKGTKNSRQVISTNEHDYNIKSCKMSVEAVNPVGSTCTKSNIVGICSFHGTDLEKEFHIPSNSFLLLISIRHDVRRTVWQMEIDVKILWFTTLCFIIQLILKNICTCLISRGLNVFFIREHVAMSGFVCDVKQVISLDWVLGYIQPQT